MKISIITPAFNSGRYILETMKSIHSQSYKNFEHIIVDGLSKDNTLEIVKKFENTFVISEKDNGQSDAINKGFRKCGGDIIAWQNADDNYLPGAFESVVKFFNDNPNVDLVYGYYQLIDSSSNWICDVYPMKWNDWMFKHGRFVPLQPTVFWRRSVLESIGLLDESLHYCMDVDYFARALNKGFNFAGIPLVLGQFRVHDESKTQNKHNKKVVKQEYKSVLARHFNYGVLDSLVFDFFQLRAQVTKKIKLSVLKKA
jgi:glycosyltransferase involved in cell wall biosynthesis